MHDSHYTRMNDLVWGAKGQISHSLLIFQELMIR